MVDINVIYNDFAIDMSPKIKILFLVIFLEYSFSESVTEYYFFLWFSIKMCLKNWSAPVTVSMVAKWPPLSG